MMKWNILIPCSEEGNNLPLVLLCIVQRSYDSGLFCSLVAIKGVCCAWPFLPNAVSDFVAVSAPPPTTCSSCPAAVCWEPRAGIWQRRRLSRGGKRYTDQRVELERGGEDAPCSMGSAGAWDEFWGASRGVWAAGRGRFSSPSTLPWGGPICSAVSSSGLPSSRKMRSYWRESSGGLRG